MNEMSQPGVSLDERIDRLAAIAVHVGLSLRHGQEVVMTAPLEALPLARRITEHAYRAGAKLVTTIYSDDFARLARFRHAPEDAFDYAPEWQQEGIARAFREGAARLAIAGEDPSLLSAENTDRVSRASRAMSKAAKPAMEQITGFRTNWTIVAAATPGWGRAMFPGVDENEAVARLWDAIFAASRADATDPIAAWEAHNAELAARTAMLNAKGYSALRYRGPGTDLEIGLSPAHTWLGGSKTAANGITCNPNIPTEEVFTTPDCRATSGTVRATKPLSYQGTLIEEIEVRFEAGRIVDAHARTGQQVLRKVLETDLGAAMLGEVALVPHSSPISASGLLFRNTLFDENAASHIALGQSYSNALSGGDTMTKDQLATVGANESLIHIDWMIGSDEIDIDGVAADGTVEALMRGGEWA